MTNFLLPLMVYIVATALLVGCTDYSKLAEFSFGNIKDANSKAGVADVISMGRDDEGGKAKKWHIGGKLEEK